MQDTYAKDDSLPNMNDDLDPEAERDFAEWRPRPRAETLQVQCDDLPGDNKNDQPDGAASGHSPLKLGPKPELTQSGPTSTSR